MSAAADVVAGQYSAAVACRSAVAAAGLHSDPASAAEPVAVAAVAEPVAAGPVVAGPAAAALPRLPGPSSGQPSLPGPSVGPASSSASCPLSCVPSGALRTVW